MGRVIDAEYDQRQIPLLLNNRWQQILNAISSNRAVATRRLPLHCTPQLLRQLNGQLPGKRLLLMLYANARDRRLT